NVAAKIASAPPSPSTTSASIAGPPWTIDTGAGMPVTVGAPEPPEILTVTAPEVALTIVWSLPDTVPARSWLTAPIEVPPRSPIVNWSPAPLVAKWTLPTAANSVGAPPVSRASAPSGNRDRRVAAPDTANDTVSAPLPPSIASGSAPGALTVNWSLPA